MRRSLSGKSMWAAIAAAVVYHELACSEGELLSEAVDRALEKRPVLIHVFIAVTVAHLLNRLPTKVDPYHWGYLIHQRMKGSATWQ